MNFNTEVADMY